MGLDYTTCNDCIKQGCGIFHGLGCMHKMTLEHGNWCLSEIAKQLKNKTYNTYQEFEDAVGAEIDKLPELRDYIRHYGVGVSAFMAGFRNEVRQQANITIEPPIKVAYGSSDNTPVEPMVTISQEEYTRLKNRDLELSCLEAQGVDNWQDYWCAMDEYIKALEELANEKEE